MMPQRDDLERSLVKESFATVVSEGTTQGERGKAEEKSFKYSEDLDFAFDCSSWVIIERFTTDAIQKPAQVGFIFKSFCANLAVGICGSPMGVPWKLKSSWNWVTKLIRGSSE